MWSFKYLILFIVVNVTAKRAPFFRKDYTYFSELDGFFKLHHQGDGDDWTKAFEACSDENSQLYYPKTADELTVLNGLLTESLNLTDLDILVGIHDPYNIGEFITVDGSSTPLPTVNADDEMLEPEKRCVSMNLETTVYKLDYCNVKENRAFICRKDKVIEPCHTIDKGYVYERTTNKCYKLHVRARTWTDAFKTCFMEGAMLLVLDDDQEYKVITERCSSSNEQAYFIGFHRIEDNGYFYTVHGVRLNDDVYQIWYDKTSDSNEACGVLHKYFTTQPCHVPYPFICEMDAF